MKLSQLIRNREVATATVATLATVTPEIPPSVATVASVAVANSKTDLAAVTPIKPLSIQDRQLWKWRVTLPDGELVVTTSPESTKAEMLEMFPDAILISPDKDQQPETACQFCQHRISAKWGQHCATREDQPRLFGTMHPARKLPEDGGADCVHYKERAYAHPSGIFSFGDYDYD